MWDEPSNESNLRLSPDGKTVVAGTLNKLVERLTAEKEHGTHSPLTDLHFRSNVHESIYFNLPEFHHS